MLIINLNHLNPTVQFRKSKKSTVAVSNCSTALCYAAVYLRKCRVIGRCEAANGAMVSTLHGLVFLPVCRCETN